MNYKKPKRYFEKSGVVDPDASYYVPLENVTNMDNQDIKTMIDLGRYFSIFAPRQSGKTTLFEGFCSALEKDFAYVAILFYFRWFFKHGSHPFRFWGIHHPDRCKRLLQKPKTIWENRTVFADCLAVSVCWGQKRRTSLKRHFFWAYFMAP